MEKPNSKQSNDSFEKAENAESNSEENSQENIDSINNLAPGKKEAEQNLTNDMINQGKFNTFQSPPIINSKAPETEADIENYKTESLKNYIDEFANLDPTESEKKIKISEKYDIDVVQNQAKNSRYENFDSNIPDADEEELQDKVTDLHDITRYGNKSIFENVRFTESVNMRIDDYKRTSNYQKLIEEELLKDQVSIPNMPESVINPKEKEKEKEETENKEEMEDMDLEDEIKKRHLTMIQKQRDTNMTLDNNLTIMELANDLGSGRGTNQFDTGSGQGDNNELFQNEYISEEVEKDKSLEDIGKKEEPGEEMEVQDLNELVNVTNLEQDEQETEKQMFKKEMDKPQEYEEINETSEVEKKEQNVEEEPQEIKEKSKFNKAYQRVIT
jgi:hypothetical protein